jgi:hypothetical protein
VRFNAWRFQREPELLVPLLDTIRQSLVDWAEKRQGTAVSGKALGAARKIGRVVRAFAAGASVEVAVVPGTKAKYDASKVLDQLRTDAATDPGDEYPQSLYFAGFKRLDEALKEFSEGNVTRIVVFVDDLDRCLPSNALDVLEAMKLFFDLPGFVFVVGLDEDIVERAVQSRFAELTAAESKNGVQTTEKTLRATTRARQEYVKKLFQVPYSLPPMPFEELPDLLKAMYEEAKVAGDQLDDLRDRVHPFLQHVARDGRINPREVKRYINAYTLQTLVRPNLDRDVVLALQTIAFRPEWEAAYDQILTDSALFIEAVTSFRNGQHTLGDLWPTGSAVPSDFTRYLASDEAGALVRAPDLEPYLFSLQSTRSDAQGWLVDAYRDLGGLRRKLPAIKGLQQAGGQEASTLASEVNEHVGRLKSLLPSFTPTQMATRLITLLDTIEAAVADLTVEVPDAAPNPIPPIATRFEDAVASLQYEMRVLRRGSTLEPAA